jgi:thymidylate synthase
MNRLDVDYQGLLADVLENGARKDDRTGTGTLSVFGRQIRHKMSDGFPLLTTKKMAWNSIVTELMWFLRGDTNIKYLVDNGCNIWNGDAYKNYCTEFDKEYPPFAGPYDQSKLTIDEFVEKIKTDKEFGDKWGDMGPIYGRQWKNWDAGFGKLYIDQISRMFNDLRTNPDSRRMLVSAWNVGELDEMVLPPCHYSFQVYSREKSGEKGRERYVSLMWNQRSVDTFLGLPFNIASYGLLLEIIAAEVGMIPDELIGNLGDTHLYLNHIDQAKEQISREPFELPTLSKSFGDEKIKLDLVGYKYHPAIKAPLSN